jgi:hypothetical protein
MSETNVGEIVVYNVRGKDIPIVHRVVRKFGSGFVSPLPGVGQVARVQADRGVQARRKAAYQGRQQRGRRHGALRSRARLSEQERHHRVGIDIQCQDNHV